MKSGTCLFVLIFLMLLSCRTENDDNSYDRLIIGEWTFVKRELKYDVKIDPTEPPPLDYQFKDGYLFKEMNICENKLGYFKRTGGEYSSFLGIETKYLLLKENLRIFDLSDSIWNSYKILKLDIDSLKLQLNDSVNIIYKRENYGINRSLSFDEIIVSSSGCLGKCPVNDIVLSRKGGVVYYGERYNRHKGLFVSTIAPEEFLKIEDRFKKSGIGRLQNRYDAGWDDGNEITVTFIQNGRIYKTVSDDGCQSPTEFYWAYYPLVYLDQKLTLTKIDEHSNISISRIFAFEKNKKLIRLSKSEGFFLSNLLKSANTVDLTFDKKYNLQAYYEKRIVKIATDGRYYQMQLRNGKYLTVDLGYDFLVKNDLLKRLSDQLEFEK